jgi:hypothetical protein
MTRSFSRKMVIVAEFAARFLARFDGEATFAWVVTENAITSFWRDPCWVIPPNFPDS